MLYRISRVVILTVLAVLFASTAKAANAGQSLPSGFSRVSVVSGIDSPTAFAFIGKKILVTEKNTGKVRMVFANGSLRSQPFLTVHVTNNDERGLLGITVDPNYASNKFIYIYYTAGPGALNYGGVPKNRVSRFTTSNGVGINETIILNNIPSDAGNHNGGDIHFGPDGKLYIAIGDGGRFHSDAQTFTSLRGKILRLNSDGSIPTDNPFYNTATGRRRATYAFGFRNPWRFTWRTSNNSIIVGDVGEGTWEELDSLTSGGGNYGWNIYEGPCLEDQNCTLGTTNFGTTIPPIHYYNHDSGITPEFGNVVMGGVFATNSNYPSGYADNYFYADEGQGWVHVLTMNSNNAVTNETDFDQLSCPVSFGNGPDNNVYVADICNGHIYEYVYTP